MRKFAAFDIDGTLVRWQLYHALVDELVKQDCVDAAVGALIHKSRMSWKNRNYPESFKSYERDLVQAYIRVLTSLSVRQFNQAVDSVFKEYKDQVYVYARDLIRSLKQQDYVLFAISGSHLEIVQKIADYYGFDDCSGTLYLHKDGKFTGREIYSANKKDLVLRELIKKHSVTTASSLALGDSAGDAAMLELVEQPIAFNPETKLFKVAEQKGWKVVLERKNMIYELESRDGKYQLAKTNA